MLISFGLGAKAITGSLGLWLGKSWGDYLVVVNVALFLPFFVVGLMTDSELVTFIIFLLDVAVVWYLVARLLRRRAQKA